MEQLCVFGAWHHNWKFWGQNHDIYAHCMSTTIYWTIWICSFHPNSKCVSAHLGRVLCFLPASVRFWLDNFLFLAATTAEGWMYLAGVTVRKFTKITTIWVRIIYSFTCCIVSDKHFLWSIFWTNTQSGFFPCCLWCAKHHPTTATKLICSQAWCEEGKVTHCVWRRKISCDKNKCVRWVQGQNSW